MLHTDFHKAFDPGRTFEGPAGPLTLEVERLGALQLTTGRIGIVEPYSLYELAPLTRQVSPGVYPVLGGIATTPAGTRIVAACRLLLGDEPPVRWELARAEGWIDAGEITGFDTDCGMLCLADHGVGPVPDFDEVFEILETDPRPLAAPLRGSRDATPWLSVASGRGDGTYAAWWGLDAQGNATTLELDFQVLWRERMLHGHVPIHPLDPGIVTDDELAAVGSELEVLPGRWPGFSVGLRVRGRGSNPVLLGPDGQELDVARMQKQSEKSRTWVFTSTQMLPDPLTVRLSLGKQREPL